MKNRVGRYLTIGFCLAAGAAGAASTMNPPTFGHVSYDGNGVLAEVVDVSPIYASVPLAVPGQRCWKKRAPSFATDGSAENQSTERLADTSQSELEPGVVRRCEAVQHWENREVLVGYNVKYRYQGRTLRTQTDRKPGDQIRVDTDLRPMVF